MFIATPLVTLVHSCLIFSLTTTHYSSSLSAIDSAYIGPHFPHIFFMTYETFVPVASPGGEYSPRIFGFKVHHSSPSLCQSRAKRVSTSLTPDAIEHHHGRRSALPFLDQENEDDSDGDLNSFPPPRLFSPVNSTVSVSSSYSSTYPHPNSHMQRSPHLSHESSAEYSNSFTRGVKRDSSGFEISTQETLVNAIQGHHPLQSSAQPPQPPPSRRKEK
jgi:hypothetical protein